MNSSSKFMYIILLVFMLFPRVSSAGEAHYVDCSSKNNGNGSFSSPWNSISAVNQHRFSAGDDVYFKVDSQCDATEKLSVKWSGTGESDRVIIGAYYGDGQFGLDGRSRPVIDGDSGNDQTQDIPAGNYGDDGLIFIQGSYQYITIKDLKIQYSGDYGIFVKSPDYVNVDNCHVYRTKSGGIVYSAKYKPEGLSDGVEYGYITNNIIEGIGWPNYTRRGACIEVTSLGINPWPDGRGRTHSIIVRKNKVFNGSLEGIGVYGYCTDCVVEYNVVRDVRSFMIYNGQSVNTVIRYNLVYESSEDDSKGGNLDRINFAAIASDNETSKTSPGNCVRNDTEIFGNLIAGVQHGIRLMNNLQDENPQCVGFGDTKIINNTIVGCTKHHIWIDDSKLLPGDNIQIFNNISLKTNADSNHVKPTSSNYITFSNNLWNGGVTGKAATRQITQDPAIVKNSGWQSLTPDGIDGSEFMPLKGSPAANNGILLDGYDKIITNSDFTKMPPDVAISNMTAPHIGAYMCENCSTISSMNEQGSEVSIIAPPPPPVVIIKQ